jgi:cyclopropane-fatty-acyl-phospholipid synthase
MSRLPKSICSDYQTISSKSERFFITKLFQKLFSKITFEIDYLDGDVRKIGSGFSNIKVAPPKLFQICRILLNPNYYLPQAFVDGHWYVSEGELSDFVVLMTRRSGEKTSNSGATFGMSKCARYLYKQYLNVESTREVRRHYNQNYKIYEAVLGTSMIYSCAFFEDSNQTLEDAQLNKLRIALDRLLFEGDNKKAVLDIGCGWGGFAFFASNFIDGKIDGISIASSQIDYAKEKLKHLPKNQKDKIEFYCCDYNSFRKEETSIYDGIVSIGMLEHVGKTQYKNYFSEIKRLLRDEGHALIHSITRPDTGLTNDWIDEYIFPGGYIPRISEVVRGIEDSGLKLENSFRHEGFDYKKTLQCWLDNLIANEENCLKIFESDVKGRAADSGVAKFIARKAYRIWYFYLASIQSIFDKRGGRYDVTQFLITKLAETNE